MKITIKSTSAKATKPKNKVKVPVRAVKKENSEKFTKEDKAIVQPMLKEIKQQIKTLTSLTTSLGKVEIVASNFEEAAMLALTLSNKITAVKESAMQLLDSCDDLAEEVSM